MPIKLQPVGEYILVIPVRWKPSSLVEIPDVCARGYQQEVEIVSTPPFRIHKKSGAQYPFQVKPGQRCLIHPVHADRKIMLDGVEHLFLEERDIVGIIERTEDGS